MQIVKLKFISHKYFTSEHVTHFTELLTYKKQIKKTPILKNVVEYA